MGKTMGKKIVLVSAFPPGRQTLNEYGFHLAKAFCAHEDVEKLVVLADVLETPEAELDMGEKLEVKRVWRFNDVATLWKLRKAARAENADLVLFNIQTASFGDREIPAALGLLTPALLRFSGQKTGVLAHNMISGIDLDDTVLKGQKLRQSVVKLGGRAIDNAVMASSYVTVTLQSYYDHYKARFPKADIRHVPHGTFDIDAREYPPYESRKRIIVTMGKFGTYKRLETLIAAVESLKSKPEYQDIELVIGGTDHPNCKGYMKSVEEANSDKSYIRFHGYVAEDDVPDFFSQAQIAVFDYSSTTGSSGVLHQTASYLCVPVFPNIGDFVDVARDEGITGENYLPNDPASMAEAIARVFSDPIKAIKTGLENRKAAEDMPMSQIADFHIGKINEEKP